MKKVLILAAILIPTVALLYFSLTRNPRELPSALVGKPAPAFELETLDGQKLSLEQARGKPLIVNFWSTWCEACEEEYALFKEAYEALAPKGVVFYSILYEDTPENAKAFLQKNGAASPILIDPGMRTSINYGVSGVPETFFIDGQGVISFKQAGELTPEILADNVRKIALKTGGTLP